MRVVWLSHNREGSPNAKPPLRQRESHELRGVLLTANGKHHVLLSTMHVRHRCTGRSPSRCVVHRSSPVRLSNALNCFPPKSGGVPTLI